MDHVAIPCSLAIERTRSDACPERSTDHLPSFPRISSTRFTFPSLPPAEIDLSVLVPIRISVYPVSYL